VWNGRRALRPILVVDDDEAIREVLRDILVAEGHTVLCAPNGRVALELLRLVPEPSMIVLDLSMPIMTGRELLAKLHEDTRFEGIPVMIISGEGDARDLGATQVLRKPLDVSRLLEIIDAHTAAIVR